MTNRQILEEGCKHLSNALNQNKDNLLHTVEVRVWREPYDYDQGSYTYIACVIVDKLNVFVQTSVAMGNTDAITEEYLCNKILMEIFSSGVMSAKKTIQEWQIKEPVKVKLSTWKIVYIAHPISGDIHDNLKKIRAIVRDINLRFDNIVPFVPYYPDIVSMDDTIQNQRERGIANDKEIFRRKLMDEVWVYGMSAGVKAEIELASSLGIPVIFREF